MKKLLTLFIALQLSMAFIGFQAFEGTFAQNAVEQAKPPAAEAPAPGATTPGPLNPPPTPITSPAPNPNIGNFYTGQFKSSNPSRYSLDGLVNVLLPGAAKWIAGFLGALAVLFLIWAGIQFLTAEGDPDKIGQATKTAFYVIAGVLLVMFASALVYLFLTIFAP